MSNYSQAAWKAQQDRNDQLIADSKYMRPSVTSQVLPLQINMGSTDALDDKQKEAINARIPAGRMGEGDEIGAAVAYLASDEASYVTGQTLHVNGGMAMLS